MLIHSWPAHRSRPRGGPPKRQAPSPPEATSTRIPASRKARSQETDAIRRESIPELVSRCWRHEKSATGHHVSLKPKANARPFLRLDLHFWESSPESIPPKDKHDHQTPSILESYSRDQIQTEILREILQQRLEQKRSCPSRRLRAQKTEHHQQYNDELTLDFLQS